MIAPIPDPMRPFYARNLRDMAALFDPATSDAARAIHTDLIAQAERYEREERVFQAMAGRADG